MENIDNPPVLEYKGGGISGSEWRPKRTLDVFAENLERRDANGGV